MPSNDIDFSARRLCPDGTCVGVIGSDGRCCECGRSASGAPSERRRAIAEPAPAEVPAAEGGFDPARRLCDDGTCVGVVHEDGRCNVCGKPAS